jgi:quinolinate synthase
LGKPAASTAARRKRVSTKLNKERRSQDIQPPPNEQRDHELDLEHTYPEGNIQKAEKDAGDSLALASYHTRLLKSLTQHQNHLIINGVAAPLHCPLKNLQTQPEDNPLR